MAPGMELIPGELREYLYHSLRLRRWICSPAPQAADRGEIALRLTGIVNRTPPPDPDLSPSDPARK